MSFLDLVHFDGATGRNRNQEAVLSSQNQRNEFLRGLEEKRIARANERTNIAAANRIKNVWRTYRVRAHVHEMLRSDFDALKDHVDVTNFRVQLSRIIIFYSKRREEDRDRLVGLCSTAVILSRTSSDKSFINAKSKLLFCRVIVDFLSHCTANSIFGMPLRFLETFVDEAEYTKLVDCGYFKSLLDVLVAISPDMVSIEITSRLPPRLENVAAHLLKPFGHDKTENRRLFARLISDMCTYETAKLDVILSLCAPYVLSNLIGCENSRMSVVDFIAAVGESAKAYTVTYTSQLFCSYLLTELIRGKLSSGFHAVIETLARVLPDSISREVSTDRPSSLTNIESVEMDVDSKKIDAITYMKTRVESALTSQEFVITCLHALDESNQSLQFMESLIRFDRMIGSFSQHLMIMLSQPVFIQRAQSFVVNMRPSIIENKPNPSLNLVTTVDFLKAGWPLSDSDIVNFTSAVKLLVRTFVCFIQNSADDDWNNGGKLFDYIPFVVIVSRELRDICLSLVDLAFPDSFNVLARSSKKKDSVEWSIAYKIVVGALQTIHQKDLLLHFLPESFWSDHSRKVAITRVSINPIGRRSGHTFVEPFAFVRYLHDIFSGEIEEEEGDDKNESGVPEELQNISPSELRNLSIIRTIPFVLSFDYRLEVLRNIIRHDKTVHGQNDRNRFHPMRQSAITVRRGELYEDAMRLITPGTDLRGYLRVSMINWLDMPEMGQDGGGIYREFMSQLFKLAFDTQRGLFILTSDRLLYPNPNVQTLYPNDYSNHYYFLGRMLGKLIYSRLMIDARFADFFLIQLLRSDGRSLDIDVQHMKSYDPVMYKNLRSLLSMDSSTLESMSLDFSVVSDVYGKSQLIELCPGGRNIRVTVDNRLEYVQSLANYYLRTRISVMVDAMRTGVSEVMDPAWLSMFSTSELQTLVSGVDADIDVLDMKRYCGILNRRDRQTDAYLDMFWDVVNGMSSDEKSEFLKFVTGCSRPPIQGFKALEPAMGLQLVPESNMLPTSATCMNMLKLPIYADRKTLEEKLRYAINADAGFEMA